MTISGMEIEREQIESMVTRLRNMAPQVRDTHGYNEAAEMIRLADDLERMLEEDDEPKCSCLRAEDP